MAMTNIIEFPNQRPSHDEIIAISKQVMFDMFITLQRHKVATRNITFLRDLAILRKFIEAAMLRQLGEDNMFTQILDRIFETLPD